MKTGKGNRTNAYLQERRLLRTVHWYLCGNGQYIKIKIMNVLSIIILSIPCLREHGGRVVDCGMRRDPLKAALLFVDDLKGQ